MLNTLFIKINDEVTKMKSLVVEDGFTNRRVLHSILSKFGTCHTIDNGLDAIHFINDAYSKDNHPFDLVCLDILLPVKNGHDILKEIRKIENRKNIPIDKKTKIIMTTGLSDVENVKKAISENSNAYLVKPISRENFLLKLIELKILKSEDLELD